MQLITLHSHVGSDGLLQLQLPDKLKNQNVTVIIRLEKSEWLSILQKNKMEPGFQEVIYQHCLAIELEQGERSHPSKICTANRYSVIPNRREADAISITD